LAVLFENDPIPVVYNYSRLAFNLSVSLTLGNMKPYWDYQKNIPNSFMATPFQRKLNGIF